MAVGKMSRKNTETIQTRVVTEVDIDGDKHGMMINNMLLQ